MRLLVPDEYRIYKRVCYSLDRIDARKILT